MVVPAAIIVGYLVSLVPERARVEPLDCRPASAVAGDTGGTAVIVTAQEATPWIDQRSSLASGPTGLRRSPSETSEYLRDHYDGGVILIESFGNESILFNARVPLTNNVYEGSYQKWDPALSSPPGQQIKWIVMRTGRSGWSGTPPNGDWSNSPDKTYRELYGHEIERVHRGIPQRPLRRL